jgi:hypothetical protein
VCLKVFAKYFSFIYGEKFIAFHKLATIYALKADTDLNKERVLKNLFILPKG